MFFCMFKGRNEYGLSLIIFSFASFFMLPGLSSVSHAKSVHEKGHMKSMMAQKVSYRVLAMDPLVVAPETGEPQGEPQASEAEAVASQGVESQGVESDVYEPVYEPFGTFIISLFTSLVNNIFPQPLEPQAVSPAVDLHSLAFPLGIEVEIIQDESHPVLRQNPAFPGAGTQVEPQAPAFEASPDVDTASGTQSIVTPVDSPQGVESEISGTQGALQSVNSFRAAAVDVDFDFELEMNKIASQLDQLTAVLGIPLPAVPPQAPAFEASPDVDAASGTQPIVTPVDSPQGVESEISGTQGALQSVNSFRAAPVDVDFELEMNKIASQLDQLTAVLGIPLPAVPPQEPVFSAVTPLDVAFQNSTPQVREFNVLDEAILLNAAGDDYAAGYDLTDFSGVPQ